MKLATVACLLAWVVVCCLFTFTGTGCSKMATKTSSPTDSISSGTSPTVDSTPSSSFAYGSDVSWVTEMEDSGYLFYNNSGVEQNLFTILGGIGINAIRLRVWVNPAGGWCNTTDVVNKALSAKAAGMKILIDFHYSDTWADPGDQNVPAAWVNQTFTQLVATVNSYTQGVLDTLQQNGITPTWVQVGNETNNGMLWPDGEASLNMQQYASLVTAGYNATKTVFASCKVIVALAIGYDSSDFEWLFDGLKANGASWDIIGMSLYTTASNYATLDAACLSNMQTMNSRYGKQVMICEAGFPVNGPTDAEAFLKDIIAKTKSAGGL